MYLPFKFGAAQLEIFTPDAITNGIQKKEISKCSQNELCVELNAG